MNLDLHAFEFLETSPTLQKEGYQKNFKQWNFNTMKKKEKVMLYIMKQVLLNLKWVYISIIYIAKYYFILFYSQNCNFLNRSYNLNNFWKICHVLQN